MDISDNILIFLVTFILFCYTSNSILDIGEVYSVNSSTGNAWYYIFMIMFIRLEYLMVSVIIGKHVEESICISRSGLTVKSSMDDIVEL